MEAIITLLLKIVQNIHKSLFTTIIGVIIILASCASVFFPPLNMDWSKASIGIMIGLALLGSPDPKTPAGGRAVIILLAVTLGFILEGCKKPLAPSTQEKDSIYVVTKTRIDTVKTPGDTVRFEVQLPCPDQSKPGQKQASKEYKFKSKDNRAELDLHVDSTGKITGECLCAEEKALIEVRDKEIHELKSRNTIEQIPHECETPWYDIGCRCIAGLAILYIVINQKFKS